MARVRAHTPVWLKVSLASVIVVTASWWLMERRDQVGNEHRLGAIASEIAGRPVRVSCPGPVGSLFPWDDVAGKVEFGGDVAHLTAPVCAELDALAEGRRAQRLSDTAFAVDVLAHESWHLRGVRDEAITECHAMATLAWTARRLGATPERAAEMERVYRERVYPLLGEAYRGGVCASSA